MRRTACLSALCAVLALGTGLAVAQSVTIPAAVPSGVLTLDASANTYVPSDVVTITLTYEQQANDPSTLSKQLNERTQQALAVARQTPSVKVSTGDYSIEPASDRDGKISAWRGRTGLVLESRDFDAAARLAGRLSSSMPVSDVSYSLSPEATRTARAKLVQQAIASFRDQAQAAASAFGYRDFTVREVTVDYGSPGVRQRFMALNMAKAAPAAAPLAIEGGNTQVSATVRGSVQMR